MPSLTSRNAGRALTAAVLLAAMPCAFGQTLRDGDVRNGLNHEPTRAETRSQERRDGVGLSPARNGADKRVVNGLDRQLLGDEKAHPATTRLPP